MFCNNCGAQITPDQKFCNNCGVALNPPINSQPQMPGGPVQPPMPGLAQPMQMQPKSQADGQQQGQPVPQGQPLQPGMAPGMGTPGMQPPKKKPIWPLILILLVALLLVSIISVYGFRWLFGKLTTRLGNAGLTGNGLTAEEEADDLLPDTDDDLDDIFTNPDDDIDDILNNILEGEGIEGLEDFPGEIDEFDDFDDNLSADYQFKDYEYASMVEIDEYSYFEPNGKVNGSTCLRPGKDLEGLCDFIDSNVLEDGRKIDRDLLYDLVSVNIIDSSLIADDSNLENNLMFCLTFANEFSGQNIRVESCMYESDDPDLYYYDIRQGEDDYEFDTWLVNISEGTLSMNYGETEYESAGQYGMFSTDTLSIWMTVIDTYYEIG